MLTHVENAGSDSDTDSNGKAVDFDELERQAIHALNSKVILPRSEIELEVEEVWRSELIGNEGNILNIKDNFFNLGGDSLKAGQVVNAMKKKFKVSMSVSDLLSAPTIEHMSLLVHNLKNSITNAIGSTPTLISRLSASFLNNFNPLEHKYTALEEGKDSNFIHKSNEHSNSSWGILLFQTIPILVLYPLRKISVWFFIAYPWITLMNMGIDRFYALVMAILISRVILSTVSPIVGICLKWLIIGRYTPGKYPLWGSMYIRWWLAEQVLSITGRGIFNNDVPIIGQYLVTIYYRLLGAKIGNNVKINTNSKLGQYDLLEIGDNVNIDASLIRPFSLEAGHFVLLPIKIGKNCTICLKSSIAAGSEIPDNTCIGPASSSHELDDAHPKYRKYCRQVFQSPPFYLQAFAGVPLILTVLLAAYIPWIYGLNLMITSAEKDGWYLNDLTNVFEAFRWWVTPERIIWYFALRVIKECLVPVLKLMIIILIKRLVLGKFKPCGDLERNSPWNLFRYWILSKLLPGGKLCGVINLVGSHYEIVSIIYRLLGATIGKRVYWPGSGVDIVEFDLLEIGDDVVFGSRSAILTSSAERSAKVCLEDGVMLADRSYFYFYILTSIQLIKNKTHTHTHTHILI
jgi:acetyltransferase-like isoleucine patch superfamily enzyme/acyl carrier protein